MISHRNRPEYKRNTARYVRTDRKFRKDFGLLALSLILSCSFIFTMTGCSGASMQNSAEAQSNDLITEQTILTEAAEEDDGADVKAETDAADMLPADEDEETQTVKEWIQENNSIDEERDAWVIAFEVLNVRRFCYAQGTVIGQFSVGEKITVTGPARYGFYPVRGTDCATGEEISGYCSSDYISFREYTGNAVQLDVVSYKQTDDEWRDLTLGSSRYTMASAGCATTCLAMYESYLTGSEISPAQMTEMLTYSMEGNLFWPDGYYQDYGSDYLLSIYQKLQQGIPVMVGSSRKDGSQHWVLVTGYDPGDRVITSSSQLRKADFIINDPAAPRYTLADYFADLPYFIKIAYYDGSSDA